MSFLIAGKHWGGQDSPLWRGVIELPFTCYGLTPTVRPDATTRVDPDTEIILERTLTLTCGFDGVPTPDVTWTQNNTIELMSDNDSRITTTTTANAGGSRVATLEITGIDRDGGGLYTCGFNNSVGDREVSVTTVLILSEQALVSIVGVDS